MTNYNWNYPTTVWVGKDRAKDLEKACVEIKTLNTKGEITKLLIPSIGH